MSNTGMRLLGRVQSTQQHLLTHIHTHTQTQNHTPEEGLCKVGVFHYQCGDTFPCQSVVHRSHIHSLSHTPTHCSYFNLEVVVEKGARMPGYSPHHTQHMHANTHTHSRGVYHMHETHTH